MSGASEKGPFQIAVRLQFVRRCPGASWRLHRKAQAGSGSDSNYRMALY